MVISRKTRRLSGLFVVLAIAIGIAFFGEATVRRASFLFKANPVAASDESIAKGAELFATNCASCHGTPGDHAAGGMVIAGQRVPAFSDLNRPASVLAMRITFGVGEGMPAWDNVLTEDEIWHLVTYVMTFQRAGGGWRPRDN
ncbi:MAG: c-type cytochrome [Loktanella sp.]|nr:c-type cytochrome [Loktanella sp.]